MGAGSMRWLTAAAFLVLATATACVAQLRRNYYAGVCPNVESIVRDAVTRKFRQTFITVGATVHLFFHDCFVEGCDASVIVASTANNTAEKDNPINLSLAGDGFDTVIKAKAAVDAVPQCRNRVSCADILAMATRDVIALAGGPSYAVELGRLDGLSSTASSVNGKLAPPSFNLDKLTALFATNGLSQTDMIALSDGHALRTMAAGSVRLAAALLVLVVTAAGSATVCDAQLRRNYYAGVCPNVEAIVRDAVAKKVQQTLTTISATVRLFFHDCFVQGCDASVIVASMANNTAEKDHPNNLSLAGDGFDTVIKAKAAVDAVPQCRNKVSCADILSSSP